MNLNKKNVFLFDGVGALLSMTLSGLVFPLFSDLLGLPKQLIYGLAIFPLIYAIFSLSCYQFAKEQKSWMLVVIMIANLIYCLVSGVLVFGFDKITSWGRVLLIAEILVVLGVVFIELKVYQRVVRVNT